MRYRGGMDGPWLLAAASEKETRALLAGLGVPVDTPEPWHAADAGRCVVLRTGVGKASACGAIAARFDPDRHAGVLCVGIAGALPGSWLEPGDAVLADPSFFADEGVLTARGMIGLDAMGFGGDAPAVRPDDRTRAALSPLVGATGPIATVSVCSGVDGWATGLAERTGAIAEAMEGAACALGARRIDPGARFAEIRVISNTTGNRERQRWELDRALERLGELAARAVGALGGR